jgi:hypothetical protein
LIANDPLRADIPDEDVAAILMPLDIYVAGVKRLARQAILPITPRNAVGSPEGRATLTAPGGSGQSRIAATCAGAADATIANAPAMMQIHFTLEYEA